MLLSVLFVIAFYRFTGSDFANAKQVSELSKTAKTKKEAPTKIRSDIIDIKRKSQMVNFIGNVVIEKGDSSMFSQKMTILYNEKNENSDADKSTKIKKIYTDQKVKIFSQDFVATGDSGYYDPNLEIFILEKNVMVNNGVSIAKGDKFIHHLKTKKSNFISDKENNAQNLDKRVTVIIGDDVKNIKKSDFEEIEY
ncbi:MAG: LptA/OstA family protein [Rickettsiales bacterium]|nr:LptA/OstA family protein [Rickettsiales bacterium]